MNINELTLGQAKELAALFNTASPSPSPSPSLGKFCVIRTYSAGVHAGILTSKYGKEVTLKDAYRIWSWTAATPDDGALSAVSKYGVGPCSKIAGPVEHIELTEAIEIIPCTEEAEASIRNGKWKA